MTLGTSRLLQVQQIGYLAGNTNLAVYERSAKKCDVLTITKLYTK